MPPGGFFVSASNDLYLSAERSSPESVRRQATLFSDCPAAPIIDRLPVSVVVFNPARQIVYANEQFRRMLPGGETARDIIGLRLGEALACLGANLAEGGCGMSAMCHHCGAGQSLAALAAGRQAAQGECRLNLCDGHHASSLDFRMQVWDMPQAGERFHAAVLTDTRNEKRLALMERIFYHDILNYVSGMRGVIDLLRQGKSGDMDGEVDLLLFAVDRINELIESQRDFSQAERGEYEVTTVRLRSLPLLEETLALMRQEPSGRAKSLVLDTHSTDAVLLTDRRLLSRILVNMLKNALEATPRGGIVTAGCNREDAGVRFWVRNAGVIPPDIRAQIFRRTFSTKGKGRGLGTHSMQLFAENYLEGQVGFTSAPGAGTEFFLRLPLALGCEA